MFVPRQSVHTSLAWLPVKTPCTPPLACCRLFLSSLLNVTCPQNTCPIFWKVNQTSSFRWRWEKPLVNYTKQTEGSGKYCILTGLLINHISYRFKKSAFALECGSHVLIIPRPGKGGNGNVWAQPGLHGKTLSKRIERRPSPNAECFAMGVMWFLRIVIKVMPGERLAPL